ncbi:hypothetical protein SAY87_013089 [Trapa incisa]|uniref:Uncharacterized protein n=1 Tax=Trapa incisa TaxID=236973 RepID=A0AAN7QCE3_9MYRT|nr:hypothetical protein SAY87_013089 [Trapa incisa]
MGSCVSASKREDPAIKFTPSVMPRPDDRPSVLMESPVKESTTNTVGFWNPAADRGGTKEEMFFDSQPWLESDCEDYFSVCDDTPSYGNSPAHPKSFREPLLTEKSLFANASPVTDPHVTTALKKQLHELFEESFRAKSAEDKLGFIEVPPYSPSSSPYNPVIIISGQTPDSVKKVKPTQSPGCCIPGLVRSLSFGERRKRMNGTRV